MTVDELDQLRLTEAEYVVLDFETVTPKGRPPEPIELAAMRIGPRFEVDPNFRYTRLIMPPDGAPITPFDTAQTGIQWGDVIGCPPVEVILREFQQLLEGRTVVLVAQNARYEAAIISRLSAHCPDIAKMPFVDTMMLGKFLLPKLADFKLDTMAGYYGLPIPRQRHRALPDVELTVSVFLKLLVTGQTTQGLSRVINLRRVAGIGDIPTDKPPQLSLFD